MADEQAKGIDASMLAVMKDIGAIGKNQKNVQQNFVYRGISDIYDAAHAAMVKHGVYMLPEIISHNREDRVTKSGGGIIYTFLTVKYRFVAGDGSMRECVVCGEGMDSGDKSSNKALAAAHKYAITQTFVTPYSEMTDGDAETPGPSTAKPARDEPPKTQPTPDEMNSKMAMFAKHMIHWFQSGKAGDGTAIFTEQAGKLLQVFKAKPELWTDVMLARIRAMNTAADLNATTTQVSSELTQLDKISSDLRDRVELAITEQNHKIKQANPFGGAA